MLVVGALLDAAHAGRLTACGPVLAVIWVLLAQWAFLLLVRRPRLGLGAEALRSAWREGGAAARRAWIWHGALVLLLLAATALWVPSLEKVFKDIGGALPAPTQLLFDLSRDPRGRWWYTVPVLAPLAYLTYRVNAMLVRVGRATAAPSATYAALTNAALVLVVLFFFGFAAVLPVIGLAPHAGIK